MGDSARDQPTLFVTGGSGFVGRHLVRQIEQLGSRIVAPSSSALDIRRLDEVCAAAAAAEPTAVIHLAYRKGDRATIVDGSRHVARAAADLAAHLVHVSTDVVFAGRDAPYVEDDEPDPIIEYGEHKAAAELAVLDEHPGAVIVRTSLVYGTTDPSPAQLDLAAELGTPPHRTAMSYFTDETRCPVHADDLAAALLLLAGRRDVAGPLHVSGAESVSRFDLAARFARFAGLGDRVDGIAAASLAATALPRPGTVALDVSRAASLGITCRSVSEVLP